MRVEFSRYVGLSLAVAVGVAMGACSGGGGNGNNAATADTTATAAKTPADTTAASGALAKPESASAPTNLTDANIVALLDEANKADSTGGANALSKATNPQVKSFARMMETDHHRLRVQGQQLAKKLNITPALPANDPVAAAVSAEQDSLQGKTGADFDRAYIAQEVTIHKDVLNLLKTAHDQAQNAQLKALIAKAEPVIRMHLNSAETIDRKLSKTTA